MVSELRLLLLQTSDFGAGSWELGLGVEPTCGNIGHRKSSSKYLCKHKSEQEQEGIQVGDEIDKREEKRKIEFDSSCRVINYSTGRYLSVYL